LSAKASQPKHTGGQQTDIAAHESEAKVGVTNSLKKLEKGLINPIEHISDLTKVQYPGMIKEQKFPSFVGGEEQRSTSFNHGGDGTPDILPCSISSVTLETVENLIGHLTTQWSHGTINADGSCISFDEIHPVGSECYPGCVTVPSQIPDMWQFCRIVGKGNHNNTSYNILCNGIPPKFHDHLLTLAKFRRHNPNSPIRFTFIVPFDTKAPWWTSLPGNWVITPAPIVLTYDDNKTVDAAIYTTVELHNNNNNNYKGGLETL
jgi:hypothetical protein